MKKRKMVAGSSSQLKISKYFCKTDESLTLDVEPTGEGRGVLLSSETNAQSDGVDHSKFDDVTVSTKLNSNVVSDPAKRTRVGVCSSSSEAVNHSRRRCLASQTGDNASYLSQDVGERCSTTDTNLEAVAVSAGLCGSSGSVAVPVEVSGSTRSLTPSASSSDHGDHIFSSGQTQSDCVRGGTPHYSPVASSAVAAGNDCCPSPLVLSEVVVVGGGGVGGGGAGCAPMEVGQDHCSSSQDDCFDFSLDEWDLAGDDDGNEYTLDLRVVHRCKVVAVQNGPVVSSKILIVSSTRSKEMAKVLVQGVWLPCRAAVGDVVSLQCSARDEDMGCWLLGGEPAALPGQLSKLAFLVEEPDMLVSGTTVVGSLFCARKSVLSERFRGFEMAADIAVPDPASEAAPGATQRHSSVRVMLIGSLVHEVLQKCLSNGLHKPFDVGRACHEVLRGRKAVWDMYAAGIIDTSTEVRKEVMQFVPKICRFMQRFVNAPGCIGGPEACGAGDWGRGAGQENVDQSAEWRGSIVEVQDIEENVWAPSLGLKGKVDVTVRARSRGGQIKEMPLELKTGRDSYSPEHQGQVLLYCAIMEALGVPVDSGLLLYLRAESMREILASRHAIRDLIMLRNDLVRYLKAAPTVDQSQKVVTPAPLPEPIRHRKACAACPYLTLCAAHLHGQDEGGPSFEQALAVDHPLRLLAPPSLKHLSAVHLQFFAHWSCLIGVELADCARDRDDALLWTTEPSDREKVGKCWSNLCIRDVQASAASNDPRQMAAFVHSFARPVDDVSESCSVPRAVSATALFAVGDRVLISCGGRVAVSHGTVVSVAEGELCISVDRDLTKRFGQSGFHVDKHEYASQSLGQTSLALLLTDTRPADRLRRLVIDREAPSFLPKLSGDVVSKCAPIVQELNGSQARAVLRALAARDFLLIKGLPGTGKSTAIVALVRALVSCGRSVLLTGHTHSSVDGVMCRLLDAGLGASLLRLGATHRIHPRLRPHAEEALLSLHEEECRTPADIHARFLSKAVVGATCLGLASHPLLSVRTFDVCVLDEAGQVLLPVALRPIFAARAFVLVGDPKQLPPVVRSHKARSLGLERTLFDVLYSPEACVTLDVQYRMNAAITRVANALSYESSSAQERLVCANEHVAQATLRCDAQLEAEPWVLEALSSRMDRAVVVVDTGDTHSVNQQLQRRRVDGGRRRDYANVCEACVVVHVVGALLAGGVAGDDIGVIAPYTDQVCLLQDLLQRGAAAGGGRVDVSTVDKFQGRDKQVIVYSFARSGDVAESEASKSKDLELLSDERRLTVAITRAKRKLICVGHVALLRTYAVLRRFLSLVPESSFVHLDRSPGFSWQRLQRLVTLPQHHQHQEHAQDSR